jgi:hypothetical protein
VQGVDRVGGRVRRKVEAEDQKERSREDESVWSGDGWLEGAQKAGREGRAVGSFLDYRPVRRCWRQ